MVVSQGAAGREHVGVAFRRIADAMELHGFRYIKRDAVLRRDHAPFRDVIHLDARPSASMASVRFGARASVQRLAGGAVPSPIATIHLGYVRGATWRDLEVADAQTRDTAIEAIVRSLAAEALPWFDLVGSDDTALVAVALEREVPGMTIVQVADELGLRGRTAEAALVIRRWIQRSGVAADGWLDELDRVVRRHDLAVSLPARDDRARGAAVARLGRLIRRTVRGRRD